MSGAAQGNTDRATTSTGKPVSILRGIAKNVAFSDTEFVQCLFRLLHDFCTDSP